MTEAATLLALADRPRRFTPANCPHCEYDRQFPDTENGGWIYTGNNGPTLSCPLCNPDSSHPRAAQAPAVAAGDGK